MVDRLVSMTMRIGSTYVVISGAGLNLFCDVAEQSLAVFGDATLPDKLITPLQGFLIGHLTHILQSCWNKTNVRSLFYEINVWESDKIELPVVMYVSKIILMIK